jgi:hypothetical protein
MLHVMQRFLSHSCRFLFGVDSQAVVAVTDHARIIVQIGRGYCFPLRKKSEAELRKEAIALGREARMRRIARAKQRGKESDAEGESEDDDDFEDPHVCVFFFSFLILLLPVIDV